MSRHSCSPRTIAAIVADMPTTTNVVNESVVVSGITQDSRHVKHGDIYCCIRGDQFDGHDFARDAISQGAVALLVDRDLADLPSHISVVRVDNARESVGHFAASLFEFPARDITMVAVTGTNGKTSTTAMLASILLAHGKNVQQIGTLTGTRTTPEAIDLHAQLALWRQEGVDSVVMEVSSHALALHRVNGMLFDVAVFTNIGRDHLDFHGTDEAYFAAKALLFTPALSRCGVVNVDDPKGALLRDAMTIPMHEYSASDATDVELAVNRVTYAWHNQLIDIPMGGSFTLMNSLAAASAALVLGVPAADIAAGLHKMSPVQGRFESLPNSLGCGVIVDYAHTPESLELLLTSVRQVCRGRVIVVFGCGGNRDAGKRPLMGRVASALADVVVVTSDNPRYEDPEEIIQQIYSGISPTGATIFRIEDRATAIESAILEARRDDIVVIAGKGHEATQEVAGVLHPFNDVDVAKKFLRQREETTS